MKRKKLKRILGNYTSSEHTINSYLKGARRPRYEDILDMNRKYKVPFTAWENIKSYLQENDTKQSNTIATPQGQNNGTR